MFTSPSKRKPLEDEFRERLESNVPNSRDCRLVCRVLGWDGQSACSLREAGEELGITRERARQIYDRAIAQIHVSQLSPSLDQALALVGRQCNRDADDVEAELRRQGFTKCRFSMPSLLKTAQVFGRIPSFAVEAAGGKQFVVSREGAVQWILKTALRSSTRTGIQKVSALCSTIPRPYRGRNDRLFVRQVLNTRRDIRWLDAGQQTFWLGSVPRNPIIRCLMKMLSYASPINLTDVRRAIGRLPAKQRVNLSLPLLTRLCEQVPFCRVNSGWVERVAPLPSIRLLSDAERVVCRILRRNGNELHLKCLQNLCDLAGVGKPNFWRIVLHSPLIFRRAPRIYRVISANSQPVQAVKGRTA